LIIAIRRIVRPLVYNFASQVSGTRAFGQNAMITRARLRHLDLLDYRPRLKSGSYAPRLCCVELGATTMAINLWQ